MFIIHSFIFCSYDKDTISASKYLDFQFIDCLVISNKGAETASLNTQLSVLSSIKQNCIIIIIIIH